ncbi:MAG: carbamate kinase [Eubacteriales bacterium]|nr:carbamate kinase [Eubacteriales bacterium]
MSKKKIVIALGGNALGNTLEEQMQAVKTTSKAIVDMIEENCEVVIVHGNGPQVGMINNAMNEYHDNHKETSLIPLSVCGAMSQAYIGYDLQNALREECINRNVDIKNVSTIITQVLVDKNDKAFQNPTKPIGQFMTKEKAEEAKKEKNWDIVEDSGRGYRRVVASPIPIDIIELDAINALSASGDLVICCGGGGIPVINENNHLKGVPAVIDKDSAACLLAKKINADMLIILTAVEKVAINFGKPDVKWIDKMNIQEANKYCEEGQFAPGSMLPKVKAAMDFANSKDGRVALITLLEKAREAVKGTTGTIITK